MPFLRADEAPTQAEREKMPEHLFGDPENKKYPLDTDAHVASAASYVEKEHNAGRLSDAKYKEIVARINKQRKARGIGEENQSDSRWQTVYRRDFASGEVTSHKRTSIGGLVAHANLTRTGVLEYRAQDGSVRRELRHPDDVFDSDSLDSLAHATITDDHPGRVTPDNWRAESIGHVAGRPERSPETTASGDQMVRGEVHIQHGPAVEKADAGALKEASCGYACKYDPTPGEYRGQRYDGRQREIRYNHVALGPPGWGRAGPEVSMRLDSAGSSEDYRVSGLASFDGARSDKSTESPMLSKEDQDKLDAATAAQKKAEGDLEKLRADSAAATSAAAKAQSDLAIERAESAKLRAENEILKIQANREDRSPAIEAAKEKEKAARLEKDINEMITLRADGRSVLGADWKHEGKTPHQIRKEIVAKLDPDALARVDAVQGASQEVLLEHVYPTVMRHDAKVREANDKLRSVLEPQNRLDEMGEEPDVEGARKAMDKKKKDAWKMTPKRKDRARMRDSATIASKMQPT
jgi:uncharacterized protein